MISWKVGSVLLHLPALYTGLSFRKKATLLLQWHKQITIINPKWTLSIFVTFVDDNAFWNLFKPTGYKSLHFQIIYFSYWKDTVLWNMASAPKVKLNNGLEMPAFGLGTLMVSIVTLKFHFSFEVRVLWKKWIMIKAILAPAMSQFY